MIANIGKREGVPVSYQLHAKQIAELWHVPKGLQGARLTNENTDMLKLWSEYAWLVSDKIEAQLGRAEGEAMAALETKLAPNSTQLTAEDRKIMAAFGLSEEEYCASPSAEPRRIAANATDAENIAEALKFAERPRAQAVDANGFTAVDRQIMKACGLSAEQYLASPSGERPR